MEELQDALEDAQYVNAINVNEGPRPITAWENPSEEVLNEWKAKLIQEWEANENKASLPKPFDFEWTLNSTLGLFLFSSYVKEVSGDYVRLCFIEEVLRWRCLRGRGRGMKLRKIFQRFLTPCESTVDDETKDVKIVLPVKTVIDELDMAYFRHGPKLSKSDIDDLIRENVKDNTNACCIGIEGPLRDKVVEPIEEALASVQQRHGESDKHLDENSIKPKNLPDFSSVSVSCEQTKTIDEKKGGDDDHNDEEPPALEGSRRMTSMGSRSAALSLMPDNLFDEIEQVILECIRQKHWEDFAQKGNSYWDKLMNFLWHEARPPVEEDFFLMRVLGRGGFGLVTGETSCVLFFALLKYAVRSEVEKKYLYFLHFLFKFNFTFLCRKHVKKEQQENCMQ